MVKARIIVCAVILSFCSAGAVNADSSKDVARRLISTITENASFILTPDDNSLEEREGEFHQFLEENIDFSFIAALVMGGYWQQMSDEQKQDFIDLFANFFLKSYASQFGGYPGEKIFIQRVRQNGATDVFVKLQLHRPNRKPTTSEWRIREFAGIPQIIDLEVAGVSVVISHKKGFHQHLSRKGVDGLLTLLRIRADRLSAQQ